MSTDPLIQYQRAASTTESVTQALHAQIRAAVAAGIRPSRVAQIIGGDTATVRHALREDQEEATPQPPVRQDPNADPLLVTGMRQDSTGDVRHIPDVTVMSGTTTRGFLAEYDEAIAAAYQRGYTDGYQVASEEAALEARVQADRDDYYNEREDDE
jgi:hypothetical protein